MMIVWAISKSGLRNGLAELAGLVRTTCMCYLLVGVTKNERGRVSKGELQRFSHGRKCD